MYAGVTGVILFGGESRRMGRDKAAIELGGTTLLRKTVELFKGLFPEVIAISREAGRLGDIGCREASDLFPGKGPMVGVLTGLKLARTDYIFAAACDMPFLNAVVIDLIVSKGTGFDIALPRVAGRGDPLHALYRRTLFDPMKDFMEREGTGLNRFIAALPAERVRYITEEEIKGVDGGALALYNMNTPEELERARKLLAEGG